jgi:hypothetical protein
MTNINIELSDDQFETLKATKKRHGLTWKGMLLHAHRELESEQASAQRTIHQQSNS